MEFSTQFIYICMLCAAGMLAEWMQVLQNKWLPQCFKIRGAGGGGWGNKGTMIRSGL